MDHKTNIHELKNKVKAFCEARDWDQFHNAKELAIALTIEASELLEIFRWKKNEEVEALFNNSKKKEEIQDEMADVLYFLLRIAQLYNLDLSEALESKLDKNNQKYPIDKFKGSHKKCNEV